MRKKPTAFVIIATVSIFFLAFLIHYKLSGREYANKSLNGENVDLNIDSFIYPSSVLIDSTDKESETSFVKTSVYETQDDFSKVSLFYNNLVIKYSGDGEVLSSQESSYIAKFKRGSEIIVAVTKNDKNTVIIITEKNVRL